MYRKRKALLTCSLYISMIFFFSKHLQGERRRPECGCGTPKWPQTTIWSFHPTDLQNPLTEQNETIHCLFTDEYDVKIRSISEVQSNETTRLGGEFTVNMSSWNCISSVPEDLYCVPKKIHFIWIGGSLLPLKYQENVLGFVKNNPDYQVFLWCDTFDIELERNLSTVTFVNATREIENFYIRDLYYSETNKGAKSDMMRYEVIFRYGGVYLDTDSVSVKPFGNLMVHSFVSHVANGWNNICNSVFAFPKGSRFLLYVLLSLFHSVKCDPTRDAPYKTGPAFFSGCFIRYNDNKIHMIHQEFLINSTVSNLSIMYQTNDATWREEKGFLSRFRFW